MKELVHVQDEIAGLVGQWEQRLLAVAPEVLHSRRNSQSRTIKQILGHLVDSASNNLHRVIHLQYQPSPVQFPDYANLGANDRWIAIQGYQEEEWPLIVRLWACCNLHLVHVVGRVNLDALDRVWISALGEQITLAGMIADYPRHLRLHLQEIEDLLQEADVRGPEGTAVERKVRHDPRQVQFYADRLAYEIDAWDLAEWRRRDPLVIVIDARPEQAYAVEHIAGAISFPHRNITFASTRDLDPRGIYVTYCDGIGCNASTKGARKLAELGFAVRELMGGLEWWKREGYQTEGVRNAGPAVSGCGCG